jgi:hypothetical protein
VYFILKSMEQGNTFRSSPPKFPTADPHYRILARQRSRFTHYYFYIHDEVLGPMAMRVASFFPFQATYYPAEDAEKALELLLPLEPKAAPAAKRVTAGPADAGVYVNGSEKNRTGVERRAHLAGRGLRAGARCRGARGIPVPRKPVSEAAVVAAIYGRFPRNS